jgi:ABC-type multidrug transport system ATPase subunit
VREHIGLAGQYAAVDENMTGFENLEMVGRLYHLGRRPARGPRTASRSLRGIEPSGSASERMR